MFLTSRNEKKHAGLSAALTKRENSFFLFKMTAAVILAAVMFGFICFMTGSLAIPDGTLILTALLFSLIYGFGLILFFAGNESDSVPVYLFFAAGLAALIAVRVAMLYYISTDYTNFLAKWLETTRSYSGLSSLKDDIGDYTVPYRFFLVIISKFNSAASFVLKDKVVNMFDLVIIKAFSCIFDVVLGYYVMKIVSLRSDKVHVKVAAFLAAVAIPTVMLNGAYWGQCDSIYASMCVASLYYAMNGQGARSVVCFSAAFALKLQAVFILPALIACIIIKKIRPRDLAWFPVILTVSILPAVFAGRSPLSAFSAYFGQMGEYSSLTCNAPSVWALIGSVRSESFSFVGVMLAGLAAVSLIYTAYVYRDSFDRRTLVQLFFVSALALPFLLPRMHDRYFIIADILSVAVFFFDRRKWYIPAGVILASFSSYYYFVMGGKPLFEQKYMALLNLIILILSCRDLIGMLNDRRKKADDTQCPFKTISPVSDR